MTIEEAREIVFIMDNDFDSHAFIRKYIYSYPQQYGHLLIKHNNVATAHGEIATFLQNNTAVLNINIDTNKVYSPDIFGINRKNAFWHKI